MKRILALAIISILVLPVFYFNVEVQKADPGTNYYVSNDGLDSNDGLSTSTPWRTIGKVNSELNGGVINQGDNIYFNRGDSWSGTSLTVRIGGTSSNPMIFGAYGSGSKPVISNSGSDIIVPHGSLSGRGYITFEYLRIANGGSGDGIGWTTMTSFFSGLVVRHCDIVNVYYGIIMRGVNGFLIENCYINNGGTGMSGISVNGHASLHTGNGRIWNCSITNGPKDGINIHYRNEESAYVGSNLWIKNCTLWNWGEAGIDMAPGNNPNGGYLIEDCEIYDCTQGGIAGGHNSRNYVIQNCHFHGPGINDNLIFTHDDQAIVRYNVLEDWGGSRNGVTIYAPDPGQPVTDLVFYHNTVVSDGSRPDHIQFSGDIDGGVDELDFKNNIFLSTATSSPGVFMHSYPNLNVLDTNWEYNMWWRGDGLTGSHWNVGTSTINFANWNARGNVANELRDDPKLNDVGNDDFTLQSTSPCIEAGGFLTSTNGGGSGTTITVLQSNYFMDGYGITGLDGDNVFVGDDNNLEVTNVDYNNDRITVNRSITWSDGESVSLSSYNGTAPDIGAFESAVIGSLPSFPEISNVDLAASDPLDTNPSFGWINITVTVTSDSGVDNVMLDVSCPDSSSYNVSMIDIGSNNYYYNTSTIFSDYGSHSYYIWANDTYGNASITSNYGFSMPPNWDIDADGTCNIMDFILVSNHYNETGSAGWIREDIDNNGVINVYDLVLVSQHYGETW